MDYVNIKVLLDKYWEGETSIAEETTLREYFNQPDIADDLKDIQPMFQYFKAEKGLRIQNEDFDAQILAQIEPTTIRPMRTRSRIVSMITRVAAVVLLLLSVYIAYDQTQSDSGEMASTELSLEDLTEEERLAFEQTKFALAFVASKLNKGSRMAAKNVKKVHKAADKALQDQ
jgi:hypothetical protein